MKKGKLIKTGIQFIKFGIVGLSNTIISLLVYYICIWLGLHYILANFLGFLVSVLNAFFWNSKCVFKEKQEKSAPKAFVKVFISYGVSFLLSTILIFLMVEILQISEWLAPLLRLLVTIPLNFLVNKFWAFKDKS